MLFMLMSKHTLDINIHTHSAIIEVIPLEKKQYIPRPIITEISISQRENAMFFSFVIMHSTRQ